MRTVSQSDFSFEGTAWIILGGVTVVTGLIAPIVIGAALCWVAKNLAKAAYRGAQRVLTGRVYEAKDNSLSARAKRAGVAPAELRRIDAACERWNSGVGKQHLDRYRRHLRL